MSPAARIFSFGAGAADGGRELKDLLGGKGANLGEMARLGMPVPPGFTITTEVCAEFRKEGGHLPAALDAELRAALGVLEQRMGARLGDEAHPLLLSVRSGARVSMPGMMDTVLNLGLNERTVLGLARQSGDERFAFDAWRRFCAMFGGVVLGVDDAAFEERLQARRTLRGAATDAELPAHDLRALAEEFRAIVKERTGHGIPDDPFEQLARAVEAVFLSWDNPRAIAYRKLNGISNHWGTAVTVQAMVFGNLGEDSGTGVAFTRNPATGEDGLYGEFLANAQGEDVVAGVRTPQPISLLKASFPEADRDLRLISEKLERHFKDVQDIEFTIQKGKLFMLQCRNGKRTGFAAVRCAVEMAEEGLITRDEALLRVEPESLSHLLRPVFDPAALRVAVSQGKRLAHGLPAGPGAASGRLVLNPVDAEAWKARGEKVILARRETSPEDISGMSAAEGLLTSWGGMTSHAALVSRQMGKVAVVGCGALAIDEEAGTATFASPSGPRVLHTGDWLSLDGFSGDVLLGQIQTHPSEVMDVLVGGARRIETSLPAQQFVKLLAWADARRRLGVRANADQADQARVAVALGAQGIGLCRTEHMFFGPGKIQPMREMILANSEPERRAALAKLLPLQRADFSALLKAMGGRPTTVRTLDPPLHEFLPHDDAGIAEMAQVMGVPEPEIRRRSKVLAESNPMLGQRGCRLGISHPEITETQVRALFEAACDVAAEGLPVQPQVMIPLVGAPKELAHQARVVREVAERVFAEKQRRVPFHVGTMIEVPRAALVAEEIAAEAEFFSFGTNDLTQMTLGLSRDDVGPVLARYVATGIYDADPFVTLDQRGVGELMRLAVERGRRGRSDLEIGLCGEHGGEARSIAFCHRLGLDYVSCSPLRVPVARLAAAQAALSTEE